RPFPVLSVFCGPAMRHTLLTLPESMDARLAIVREADGKAGWPPGDQLSGHLSTPTDTPQNRHAQRSASCRRPDLASVPPGAVRHRQRRRMTLATPLIMQFAAELSKLPVEEQQRRIAKVLAAMRDEEKIH